MDYPEPTGNLMALASYQALLDAAVDAIILIDADGIIHDCNPVTTQLFGYERVDLLGSNVSRLMPEPDHSQHDGYLRRYLDTGERRIIGIGRRVSARRSDGSEFPVELAVGEIRDRDQVGFVGFLRDLSERNALQEELRARNAEIERQRDMLAHANRMDTLGQMATGIAHEINQPLAAASNYTLACRRLIEAGRGEEAVLLDTLDKISAQVQRAADVIHSVRRLARRSIEAEPAAIDVAAAIASIRTLLELDARQSAQTLVFEFADSLPAVRCDPVQLQQIVTNLVRNALEAQSDSPASRVRIGVQPHGGGWVRIEVQDQGPGIDPELADSVFEPFVSNKPDGLGLGLSICRSLARSIGGELALERTTEGGCLFSVLLPADDDSREDA